MYGVVSVSSSSYALVISCLFTRYFTPRPLPLLLSTSLHCAEVNIDCLTFIRGKSSLLKFLGCSLETSVFLIRRTVSRAFQTLQETRAGPATRLPELSSRNNMNCFSLLFLPGLIIELPLLQRLCKFFRTQAI
jgi:hypothetical protein